MDLEGLKQTNKPNQTTETTPNKPNKTSLKTEKTSYPGFREKGRFNLLASL